MLSTLLLSLAALDLLKKTSIQFFVLAYFKISISSICYLSELLGGYGDSTIKLWERHFPSSGYTWISNKKISAVFGKSH